MIINEKSIIRIKEQMLGCGSWEWYSARPTIIIASEQLCQLLEIDFVETISFEQMKTMLFEVETLDIKEHFEYQISKMKEQFDIIHHVNVKSKKEVKVNHRIYCQYDDMGKPETIIGVCIDMSYNNKRDYTTRLNNEKFYRLFGDAPIGISLLKIDGTCFLCNEALTENVRYKEFELKDLPFHSLIEDDDQHGFISLYHSVVDNRIPSFRNEFRIKNKNGEKVWQDITVSSVRDIYDKIKYLIVMVQPCQRNKKQGPRRGLINTIKEELNDLSLRDSLSGLYNRQYVLLRLKELILIFYERHLSFSALLVDVDHIKGVNDQYGHACGDKVIHDLSDIFKSLTRDSDICARWGGEEFIILFPEMSIEIATELAERLRNEVKNTIIMWEGREIQVTVSVSVTSYTSDDTLKTFINKVDKALYDEKSDKRDHVVVI